MPRVPAHDTDTAPAASRDALKRLEASMGKVLNIFGSMARSPAVLNGLVGLEDALAEHATLSEAHKQAIRLAVAGRQDCHYCQSAYTTAGRAAGLTEGQTIELRSGGASFDGALDALIGFAVEAFDSRGHVRCHLAAHPAGRMARRSAARGVRQRRPHLPDHRVQPPGRHRAGPASGGGSGTVRPVPSPAAGRGALPTGGRVVPPAADRRGRVRSTSPPPRRGDVHDHPAGLDRLDARVAPDPTG